MWFQSEDYSGENTLNFNLKKAPSEKCTTKKRDLLFISFSLSLSSFRLCSNWTKKHEMEYKTAKLIKLLQYHFSPLFWLSPFCSRHTLMVGRVFPRNEIAPISFKFIALTITVMSTHTHTHTFPIILQSGIPFGQINIITANKSTEQARPSKIRTSNSELLSNGESMKVQ